MKKIFFLLLLYICVFQYHAKGQLPCYTPVREDGLKFMRKGEYAKAIDQFWLALTSCEDKPENHDLHKLIREAQRTQIAILEDNIQQKKMALADAESAKTKAQELELLEREARKRADDNATLAIKEGRLAESLRLALLSDMARERGNITEAFQLASIGVFLSTENPTSLRSFGAAVRDSFSQKIYTSNSTIEWFQPIGTSNKVLVKNIRQELFLIDLSTNNISLLATADDTPLFVNISPSGKFFMAWSDKKPLRLWSAEGTLQNTWPVSDAPMRCAAISTDDSLIVSGGRDHIVRLWTRNGQLLAQHQRHQGVIFEAGFSTSSDLVFSRGADGMFIGWNWKSGQSFPWSESRPYFYDLEIQNNTAASGASDGSIVVIQENKVPIEKNFGEGAVLEVRFCPNTSLLLARTAKGQIFLFNPEKDTSGIWLDKHSNAGMTWSAATRQIMTWSSMEDVSIWDEDGKPVTTIAGIPGGIKFASFSNDGRYVLLEGKHHSFRLADYAGNILMEFYAIRDIPQVTLLPDNKQILFSEGASLSICPLPEQVMIKINAEKERLLSVSAQELIKKHHIQFVDLNR